MDFLHLVSDIIKGALDLCSAGPEYRKISNIRRTKSPNLNVPRLVLQLYLPKLLMPGIKSRMKM